MTPQVLRIILTTIALVSLKVLDTPLIYPIASLFILDLVDCDFYRLYDKTVKCSKKDTPYQISDKILDLYAYLLFIILFYKKMDKLNLTLFICFFIYRAIGVYQFYKTEDREYIKIFFDGMNGLLVLLELSNRYSVIKNNYTLMIGIMILIKILFERIHHTV
jgi:hypothetical protein